MRFDHAQRRRKFALLMCSICFASVLCLMGVVLILSIGKDPQIAHAVEAAPEPLPEIEAIVPIRDIEAGELLSPQLFRSEKFLAARVSPAALRSVESIKNQYARSFLVSGEPVHRKLIEPNRSPNPIFRKLKPGHRLITIRVNDITSVDGFVRPGEYVDVSWIHSADGTPTLTVIVQNALVVGADRNLDPNWKPSQPVPGTVTLMVPAKDSRAIQLALSAGTLSLSLRGDNDYDPEAQKPLTLKELNRAVTPEVKAECRGKLRSGSGDDKATWCLRADGTLELEEP